MDINELFPNFHLDIAGGGFWTHEIWPIKLDSSRYEMRFFVPKPETVREAFHQEHYIARLADVVLEDLANVERTHKGVAAGIKKQMYLQDNEVLIRRFMKLLECFEKADTLEDAMRESAHFGDTRRREESVEMVA